MASVADAVRTTGRLDCAKTRAASQPRRTASAPQSDGRWIQISERKTQDGGTVGVFTDVTELKRAEEALREKTEFLAFNQVITAAANEAASVESAIQIALDQVCAQTGWPVGHAYMLAGDGELVTSKGLASRGQRTVQEDFDASARPRASRPESGCRVGC